MEGKKKPPPHYVCIDTITHSTSSSAKRKSLSSSSKRKFDPLSFLLPVFFHFFVFPWELQNKGRRGQTFWDALFGSRMPSSFLCISALCSLVSLLSLSLIHETVQQCHQLTTHPVFCWLSLLLLLLCISGTFPFGAVGGARLLSVRFLTSTRTSVCRWRSSLLLLLLPKQDCAC